MALSKPVHKIKPFAGKEHPSIRRLASPSWQDSVEDDLGANAPRSLDPNAPVDGFSCVQGIPPLFDRRCVSCHHESQSEKRKLRLTGAVARDPVAAP